ncbi:hypothetical protein [Celeribacter marinus]|uniref:hypothetical protein n=1 Tax=Celeribacter marinus TaxID=1397108 RepID=UPI003F6A7652
MAYVSNDRFSTVQGRAKHLGHTKVSRLPVVTLGLGAVASLAIAAGAFNWLPVQTSITDELSNIEFLTGTVDGTH